mgnify:CR=1 FL=1
MAKQANYILGFFLAVLTVNLAYAADETPVNTESNSATNAEELVLNQAEEIEEGESDEESPEGDDDFVPSLQISEDLSVSFPVDI